MAIHIAVIHVSWALLFTGILQLGTTVPRLGSKRSVTYCLQLFPLNQLYVNFNWQSNDSFDGSLSQLPRMG